MRMKMEWKWSNWLIDPPQFFTRTDWYSREWSLPRNPDAGPNWPHVFPQSEDKKPLTIEKERIFFFAFWPLLIWRRVWNVDECISHSPSDHKWSQCVSETALKAGHIRWLGLWSRSGYSTRCSGKRRRWSLSGERSAGSTTTKARTNKPTRSWSCFLIRFHAERALSFFASILPDRMLKWS